MCIMMKNSFLVPVVFISSFLLWLLLLSVFGGIRIFLLFGNGKLLFFIYAFLRYAYLILPAVCTLSIFSVFVFLMRHKSKLVFSSVFLILIFSLFFLLIIPAIYSKGEKIERNFEIYKNEFTNDSNLVEFVEMPVCIKTAFQLIKPICNDIYASYRNSYINYLILAGAFFTAILSLYGCTTYTSWKIINFALLPFWWFIILYGYAYLSNNMTLLQIKRYLPFPVQEAFIPPIGLVFISCFFNIAAMLLFLFKKTKK